MTFCQHRGGTPFRAQKQSISKPPPPYAREKVKSWLLRRGSDFDVARNLEKAKQKVEKAEQNGEKWENVEQGKKAEQKWKKHIPASPPKGPLHSVPVCCAFVATV